jgi:hypothetical protein
VEGPPATPRWATFTTGAVGLGGQRSDDDVEIVARRQRQQLVRDLGFFDEAS